MTSSLDKRWKEILYAFSGFGPNLLMVIMGAYFTDAINPAAMGTGSLQVINGTCLILPALFPILWMIAKAFDGIVDVPLAALTDSLSTKWGKRRPPIAIGFIPMLVSFVMCWIPIGDQTFYTIWLFFWALIFFATYTMCMICFYGSLSYVCQTENQRVRLSSYKAFFDTITYCFAYALVPVLLGVFNVHIDKFVLATTPIMFTILIPLFMIKEGAKYGYPERQGIKEERVSVLKSLKMTFGNRIFRNWTIVNCCSFFGLQMFLVAMNAMIIGGMGFSSTGMAILNTCAFAPVPIMLYLFNKLRAKKGIRFGLQICLIAFAVAIFSFDIASIYVMGKDNVTLQYIIGIIGGILGSFSIGVFFMVPYVVPVQVAAVEEKVTGVNHSAMYFAAQALATTIVGAVAGGGIYENIKMFFIDKASGNIVSALNTAEAATKMGVSEAGVFNLGTLLVPIIVSVMCIIGFIVTFKLPKHFSADEIAEEFKRTNPDLDVSKIKEEKKETEKDSVFVNCALWVLSGSLFGFIWTGFALSKAYKLIGKKGAFLNWLLCLIIPFYSVFAVWSINKKLKAIAEEKGKKITCGLWHIIFAFMMPVLPLNVIGLALLTKDTERLVD